METRVVGGKTPKAANRGDTSLRLDGFGGTVRVSDAAGNVSEPGFISLDYVTLQGETWGGTSVAGHTRNNKNLGPVRHLIYEIPVRVREVTVPLEYKNIDTKLREAVGESWRWNSC